MLDNNWIHLDFVIKKFDHDLYVFCIFLITRQNSEYKFFEKNRLLSSILYMYYHNNIKGAQISLVTVQIVKIYHFNFYRSIKILSLAPKMSKSKKKYFFFFARSLHFFSEKNPMTKKSVWCGLNKDYLILFYLISCMDNNYLIDYVLLFHKQ